MKKITVIGAGSWGTALSMILTENGHEVRIWGNDPKQLDEINQHHTNQQFLPEVILPAEIKAYHSLEEALDGVDTVLVVVPTKVIRVVMKQIAAVAKRPLTIIHASKGIEPGTSKRISEMITEEMPGELLEGVVVLSGPSHAEEVAEKLLTTVTSASTNLEAAGRVQDLFMNHYFRVYTNPDVIGVELGGALKNIIALGAGVIHGLGYGDNAKAALMTRGLVEITRLGVAMGARKETFSGLTGMGDLIVTCTSVHSRNWRAGNMIGKGQSLDDVLEGMGMVVEGVRTAEAAHILAEQVGIEMPITNAIYSVLFEGKCPKEAAADLMGRVKKHEMEDVEI